MWRRRHPSNGNAWPIDRETAVATTMAFIAEFPAGGLSLNPILDAWDWDALLLAEAAGQAGPASHTSAVAE